MKRASLYQMDPLRPSPRRVAEVVARLRRGGVIAYPTDSVYGIGCDLHDRKAVDRIYRIKGYDHGHLLSFLCPDLSGIAEYAHVTDFGYRWLKRLLPGPYTVILEARREVPRILLEKRRTVGIRVPDHPLCQALVRELGSPLISTSATAADGVILLDGHEIQDKIGAELDLIIEGGPCEAILSTVVSLVGDEIEIIREGKGVVEGLLR